MKKLIVFKGNQIVLAVSMDARVFRLTAIAIQKNSGYGVFSLGSSTNI